MPHLLLAYLTARHEEFVPRAGARLAAAYHLTCPFYFFAPEAPPWWASEKEGRMGGEIERVARLVVCDVLKRPPPKDGAAPGNPWGAMPSDHISSAAITAMGLAEVGPVYGAIGWTYVAAAAFAIVYLGEHYVADVVVGLLDRRDGAPRRAARGAVRARRRARGRVALRGRLHDADEVVLGIAEDADHGARHDLAGAHQALAAEALGLGQRGLDVRHLDVERHAVGHAVVARDPAADARPRRRSCCPRASTTP